MRQVAHKDHFAVECDEFVVCGSVLYQALTSSDVLDLHRFPQPLLTIVLNRLRREEFDQVQVLPGLIWMCPK